MVATKFASADKTQDFMRFRSDFATVKAAESPKFAEI